MPTLCDLSETGFDPDLHLPIDGHTYTVLAPGYEEAKRLREVISDTGLPTVEQVYEAVTILGEKVLAQMEANGVKSTQVLHAGRTALLHFGFSPDMGRIHWELGHLGTTANTSTYAERKAEAV